MEPESEIDVAASATAVSLSSNYRYTASPRRCTCQSNVNRVCLVTPSPLYLRSGPELDSLRVGTVPSGAKVIVLAEERPTQALVRALIAHEKDEGRPLGWITTCREGTSFLRPVSASKTPRGFFTSALGGDDGFSRIMHIDALRDRYNSVAATIETLQKQAAELQRREEEFRLTGKILSPDRDPMFQWSFQAETQTVMW